jgi:hypothetical protein
MAPEEEMEDWESGPYCQHWSDPSDCEVECTCGHFCRDHCGSDDCLIAECKCESFANKKEGAA